MEKNTATSSNFRVEGKNLTFIARVSKSADYTMASVCINCPISSACFGELSNKDKKARVNLFSPLVASLSQSEDIPCGAGVEIIARSPHK